MMQPFYLLLPFNMLYELQSEDPEYPAEAQAPQDPEEMIHLEALLQGVGLIEGSQI